MKIELVEVLIKATKDFDNFSLSECYAITNLLFMLDVTRTTQVETAKRLVHRNRYIVDQVI